MKKIEDLVLLYVEDEVQILERYGQYFKAKFKKVYLAEDGKKALELYEDYHPDVLILDINLPKITGLDLAEKIRKTDKKTKILLLTARQDKEILLKAIELGLVTYLEKPMSRASLENALKKIENSYDVNEASLSLWRGENFSYSWNLSSQRLFKEDLHVKLTKKETSIFEVFVSNFMQTFTYEEIYDLAWDDTSNVNIPAIKTLIQGLRKKLPEGVLKSTYGIGYYLDKNV